VTKILIAEDDLMIADFLEEILIDAGYTVCGIATTVAEAVKLGNEHHPGLAILDLRLKNGDLGTKIVPLLTECDRVGVLYATGNDNVDLTQANGDICIRKPYQAREWCSRSLPAALSRRPFRSTSVCWPEDARSGANTSR
jgi:DNA-binding response OmpR family regulator